MTTNIRNTTKPVTKTTAKMSVKPGMYYLPDLPYGYKDLEPYISEEQLKLHHQKHHQAYVNGANSILAKLDKARSENTELDIKPISKELSFNVGGITLHTLFWENMAPAGKGGGGEPADILCDAIRDEFGSFDRFKKLYTSAATSCEGSGWAALTYCQRSNRLMIMQIEKHNVNFPPGCPAILVLDVWEHAYYLDYKNERPKFVEAFWNIINWNIVKQRFENL
jgi:superoxide dismutase, Fe-Mn family